MSDLLSRDESVRTAYASDVSGLVMVPEAVARPASAAEVAEVLAGAAADGMTVTAAGGQTSTTAASITDRGVLLSLRAMDGVLDVDARARVARVQAGVLLGDLQRVVRGEGLFFPPDPTSEADCTVGGAIACNASGPRTLRYGPTRRHVRALTVVLAGGETVQLRRPLLEKNTVGYGLAHDPMDWFIGSEGTLGVVVEAEVALLPIPERVVGLGLPFADERAALACIVDARRDPRLSARALEYLDEGAVAIMREAAGGSWAPGARALVYAEEAPADGQQPALDAWLELAERHGVRDDAVDVYDDEAALREARRLRHAVPWTMNERGNACRAAGGRRISTDWAVPYERLAEAIAYARAAAERAGIEQAVIFGHAGNGHPHQNFVARDAAELARVEAVVEDTLRHVIALGGTVAAEHGIGKVKRRWLPLQMTPLQMAVMRAVKRELDPQGLLAPGNIL